MPSLNTRLPIYNWLPGYSAKHFRGDLTAGFTLAVMLVPQGMAYSMLAGLPPVYGLYAAVVPLIVYTFLGSSLHLAVGVTAIDSIIIGVGVGALSQSNLELHIELVLLLSLIVGVIFLTAGLLRLGVLVNLISRPVIVGFTSAIVIVIGLGQIGNLVGVPIERTQLIDVLLREVVRVIPLAHPPTILIGLGSTAALLILKRWRRLPGAFLVVAATTLAVFVFELDKNGVNIVGPVPSGLPSFQIPDITVSRVESLLPTAAALALIQFANIYALGRVFASKYRYSIRPNMELLAFGGANLAGGLFQSYPVSGSYSRSAIGSESGSKTPLANLFSAALVAVVLLFFTDVLKFVPTAALAAIVMVAVFGLFRPLEFVRLYRMKRTDGGIAILTFAVTLIFGLKYGILAGVIASIAAIMERISRPNIAVLGHIRGTRSYRDVDSVKGAKAIPGIFVVRMDASFTFANAELLREVILRRCNNGKTSAVVLDASTLNDIDTTAIATLGLLVETLRDQGVDLYISGLHGDADETIRNSHVFDTLGTDHIFLSPHRAVKQILEREGRLEWYLEQTRPPTPFDTNLDIP